MSNTLFQLAELSLAIYKALGIDASTYVTGLSFLRDRGCAPRDMSAQALTEYRTYLDYVINAMS